MAIWIKLEQDGTTGEVTLTKDGTRITVTKWDKVNLMHELSHRLGQLQDEVDQRIRDAKVE